MSDLKTNLEQILQEKQTKIIPENIKKNVEIFGITGTLEAEINTSDATATSDDILYPKTAYVNGEKITGNIATTQISLETNVESEIIPNTIIDSFNILYGLSKDREYLFIFENNGSQNAASNTWELKVYKKETNSYILNTTFTRENLDIDIGAYLISIGPWGLFNDDNKLLICVKHSGYNSTIFGIVYDKLSNTITMPHSISLGEFNAYGWSNANPIYPDIVANSCRISRYTETGVKNIYRNDTSYNKPYAFEGITQWSCNGEVFTIFKKDGSGTVRYFIKNYQAVKSVTTSEYVCLNTTGDYAFVDGVLKSSIVNTETGDISFEDVGTEIVAESKIIIWLDRFIYIVLTNTNNTKKDTKYSYNVYVFNESDKSTYNVGQIGFIQENDTNFGAISSGQFNKGFIGLGSDNNLNIIYNSEEPFTDTLTYKNRKYYSNSDVTVTSKSILQDKIAYNASGKIIGTMPNNGTLNYTPNTTQQAIPAGYTSGGTVAGDSNLIPENIKKDISIFDVTGTLETGIDTSSDNPITADDVVQGKEGFVNGEKITGSLYKYPDTFTVTANHERTSVKLDQDPVMQTPSINISIQESSFINTVAMDKWKGEDIYVSYDNLVSIIGLTPEKIKAKETILGITGTYQGEGVIDYTGNNFEIINNKYLKFKTINYGVNTDIESLPQFRIPDEMLGVFINNKDNLIINMTKDYNRGSLYKFAVYTTTHTADYLEISCTGTSSSSFQREEVYKLGTGGNFDNPICYAVRPQPDETEINTVIDSTSDFKFNYYEFECDTDTDSYSNFRANTTSSYQDIDVEYLYQAALVGGTNGVESKFYLGTYFTDMNYMNKPASIDNVSMEYKNITDFSVPAMLLNNTQEIHLTSSQLSDTGTAITQDGSWKLTNPEGIITTEIANPTIQSYVRGLNPKGSTSTFSYRMVSDYLGLTYYKNLSYNRDYKLYVDDIEWTGSVDFDVDMKILLVSSSGSEYELYNNSLYSGEYWESSANSISGSNDPTYYWRYACDHIKLVIDVIMNYRP